MHAHGMVTVQTEDGQEIEVYGKGWQAGDQVECQRKDDGKAGTCQRLLVPLVIGKRKGYLRER